MDSRFQQAITWLNHAPLVPGWDVGVAADLDSDGVEVRYIPGPDNPCDPVVGRVDMMDMVRRGADAALDVMHDLADQARELYTPPRPPPPFVDFFFGAYDEGAL